MRTFPPPVSVSRTVPLLWFAVSFTTKSPPTASTPDGSVTVPVATVNAVVAVAFVSLIDQAPPAPLKRTVAASESLNATSFPVSVAVKYSTPLLESNVPGPDTLNDPPMVEVAAGSVTSPSVWM